MEISSPARLAPAYVDCDPSVAGHDANKSYLLISAPAPDAGADRNGHRIRLTSPGLLAFRALRLLSSDVCRLKMAGAWRRPLGTLVGRLKTASASGLESAPATPACRSGGRVQQPPKTLVSRLKTANANFRERDECARSLMRGIGTDVDTPTRQPCCESRILALATDGERQLIIRYHDTRSSQALIDHGHRSHLCRR